MSSDENEEGLDQVDDETKANFLAEEGSDNDKPVESWPRAVFDEEEEMEEIEYLLDVVKGKWRKQKEQSNVTKAIDLSGSDSEGVYDSDEDIEMIRYLFILLECNLFTEGDLKLKKKQMLNEKNLISALSTTEILCLPLQVFLIRVMKKPRIQKKRKTKPPNQRNQSIQYQFLCLNLLAC